MTEPKRSKEKECPNCQAILPVHAEYITWCDECGWNLNPQIPDEPSNIFEKAYATLGQRQSQAILDRLVRSETLKPKLSVSKVLAIALAAFIHGITLLLLIGGIAIVIMGWPNILAIAGGILCLGTAWVLRPTFAERPSTVVSRNKVPTLYKLVSSVADSSGAPDTIEICIDGKFAASYMQVGWQQEKVLLLGLPLWSILTHPERIALIAHELAHGVNGDVARSRFIKTAIGSLMNWYRLLRPDHIWPSGSGLQGLLMAPVNLFLLALSQIAVLGIHVLGHLMFRDSQRAEYLADYLACTVAGTEAMLSLLDKLHLGQTFQITVKRVALGSDKTVDLFEELRQRVERVPQRELERVSRVQQLASSRLDVTHPPTRNRIQLIRSHAIYQPKVTFPPEEFEKLEEELLSLREATQRKVIDSFRASLYKR
jgi:heat shock protein HtpX